jgi:hypothetical protein
MGLGAGYVCPSHMMMAAREKKGVVAEDMHQDIIMIILADFNCTILTLSTVRTGEEIVLLFCQSEE